VIVSRVHGRLAAVACAVLVGALTTGLPVPAAAASILESVQTQALPNQHVRVVLQFSAPVVIRPVSNGATTTFVMQIAGATMGQSISNVMPINLGALQSINVSPYQGGVNIALSFTSPLRPTVGQGGQTGLYVIDVPPGSSSSRSRRPLRRLPRAPRSRR